jgi:hypothetical protein
MASSLADLHGNTSMSLDHQILQGARLQHLHSHFARCTRVSWHSLTLMVSCLALVNDFHHWSVIQCFLFMLDIDTFIRMIRLVPPDFASPDSSFFAFPSIIFLSISFHHQFLLHFVIFLCFWHSPYAAPHTKFRSLHSPARFISPCDHSACLPVTSSVT